MMERAERAGLGVALVGHAALFALLSLRLLTRPIPVPPPQQAIEVSLAPDVALERTAPPSPTPPAPSEAPEQGPPEEAAAPPEPAPPPKPVPAKPRAEPAPAKPAPAKPKPAPPKPDRQADADRLAAVVADAERADAARAAKAAAKAAAHAAWVEKVKAENAAKADAARAAADRAQAAQAAQAAAAAARTQAAAAKAQAAAARAEAAQAAAAQAAAARADAAKAAATQAAAARKARGSRLGADFLKGLADTPARPAPSAAAPGVMSAIAAADIRSAIQRQIQPCANRQVNPGPGAEGIRVTLNLKLNRDGSLAAAPAVLNHEGVDGDNRRYLDRVDDLAKAAFIGCAPLHGLPANLYDVPRGWRSINMTYKLPG